MRLSALPWIDVTVCVDQRPLHEYDDIEGQAATAHKGLKYIEASFGSNFLVRAVVDTKRLPKPTGVERVVCCLYLDGKAFKSTLAMENASPATINMLGLENNERSTMERFKFAQLVTSESKTAWPSLHNNAANPGLDESSAAGLDVKPFTQLGEIRVEVNWVRLTGVTMTTRGPTYEPLVKDTLPEKCLKGRALSSISRLDKPEALTAPVTYHTLDASFPPKRIAEYIFRYRARRDLQIEGIIPRDPSPAPLQQRDANTIRRPDVKPVIMREKRGSSASAPDENDDIAITGIARCAKRRCADGRVKKEPEIIDLSGDE